MKMFNKSDENNKDAETIKQLEEKLEWNRNERSKYENLYKQAVKDNIRLREALIKSESGRFEDRDVLSMVVEVEKNETMSVEKLIEKLKWNRRELAKLRKELGR